MPVALLDRVPLPNLKIYSCGSVLALSACVYFAIQVTKDPTDAASAIQDSFIKNDTNFTAQNDGGRSMRRILTDIFHVMIREPVCVWTLINMAFCWFLLLGSAVQRLIFGDLRVAEQQHLKDKFWNFVFYKFIFVCGIINVQYIDEVLMWCSWFSLLGFLHLLSQLGKDRFEYLSFSPTTPLWNHVKLLFLLGAIFALSGLMLLISVFVGFFGGFHTFAFMSAEVILLSIRTLHVIIRYGLHLYDMRQDGTPAVSTDENKVWERRGPLAYYVELTFEFMALSIDFVHHLHMLLWGNIFLSMASLVVCMQLRYLFHELQRRFRKHRNYLWVRNHLEQNYPMATSQELLENSDNCAICWEKMESARKLPCTHLFHNTCLLSWLEQDTSCPTCRLSLNIQNPSSSRHDSPDSQADVPQPIHRHLNHFFHFDGSRYVSWLPSFSVEVSHPQAEQTNTSQMDAMARQVQQLFPHIPLSVIKDDLRITRSVELTIENVLDGRVPIPAIFREPEVVPLSLLAATSSTENDSRKWSEIVTPEVVEVEDTTTLGSRFSKSSAEREKILHRRKEHMLQNARRRYIERQRTHQSQDTED